jgi:hypothetical protein
MVKLETIVIVELLEGEMEDADGFCAFEISMIEGLVNYPS